MSTTLLIAMEDSVLTLESSKTGWKIYESLKGTHPQCIAFDPNKPNRVYCGTFGYGLWKSDDGGETWGSIENANSNISSKNVMSISVSNLERGNDNNNGFNAVYTGTEPSALYRSDDGGESWERMSLLNNLKSSSSWSFPPRPWTHHVRWIEPDVNKSGYVYVAIEAGALVQSHDGGKTWIDKVEGGPYDTHTLATNKKAPGRLYSAAGDGYFESYDYGKTWKRSVLGLDDNDYLVGLAVDLGDPESVIVSASRSAILAHSREDAESLVYRRGIATTSSSTCDADHNSIDEEWEVVAKGLPESHGTIISTLAANPKVAGEFYALNNRGIFCSIDSGVSWKMLDSIEWPKEFLSQHPWALAVREVDR
jgi:BNR/Asp-box repeat